MCGIFGMNRPNEELVNDSIDLFSYRGPDSNGSFSDEFVALAFRRLAIIDLDPRSNQPMHDDEEKITIVFNGEIYNYHDLRKELSKDYQFNTASDTEVLLYAYKKWGTDLTKYIKGMFAFCVYDRESQKFYIFRDFSGIKPLYYYHENGLFIFSSEIKGILHSLKNTGRSIEIDKAALKLYYSLGSIPSPLSLYRNIYKLPPRSFLVYDIEEDQLIVNQYKVEPVKITCYKEFASLFEKKVLDHLVSDVPVGLYFSGGTDSTAIAVMLNKNNVSLQNFSIRMAHKKTDSKFFEEISDHLKIKSHVYDFGTEEFDEIYHSVMNLIDEPFVDGSIFPTYYLSRKAAEKVKVVLSGEGGDEYFYGYDRHRVLYKHRDRADYSMTILDRLYFRLPQHPAKTPILKALFKLNRQPISYYLADNSIGKDLVSWQRCKEEMRERNMKPLDIDKLFYLENDLLRKIDLATSYNSIEGRVPLLDIDIIQNSYNFEKNKLSKGQLKYILKKMLQDYLPDKFIFRKKSGFGINMKNRFKESKFLVNDYNTAILFLRQKDLLPETFDERKINWYTANYANFCYSLIVLYYALRHSES